MQLDRSQRSTPREDSVASLLEQLDLKLKRVFSGYGIPAQDAEDLLQQTLLAFVHKRSSIRNPEVWIVGALKKQCLLYLRSRRRQLYESIDAALLDVVAKPTSPSQEQAEVAHDLRRAIAGIPDRCRSILDLRYRLGYDAGEVAERLGYRSSSIRKVTSRCLAALTKQMIVRGFPRQDGDA